MKDLSGIWILDKDGDILFENEFFTQGSGEFNSALFSGVILAVQTFVKNLGEEKIEQMEFGNSIIYVLKDDETNLIYILRIIGEAKNKKFNKILEKIQQKLQKVYYDNLFSLKILKEYVKSSFNDDLKEILKDKREQGISDFFQSI